MAGLEICAHGRVVGGYCSECYREAVTFPEPATHDELRVILERVEAKLDRLIHAMVPEMRVLWGSRGIAEAERAIFNAESARIGSPLRIGEDTAEDRPTFLTPEQIKTLGNLGLGGTPCSDPSTDPHL